jgi:hypothetical protein
MNIEQLTDDQKARLVENRWNSSDSLWSTVDKAWAFNTRFYDNTPEWLQGLPRRQPRVRANRIFTNMESVINSLIANPPKPQMVPTRDTPEAKELAQLQEKYFDRRFDERNVKETMRKALRNLYFGRLLVLKPYWDAKINDFNVRAVDPRKVRFGKTSTKEDDSEFAIEEITDTLSAVIDRFPEKKDAIIQQAGMKDESDILINNPDITYKEAWIRDYVIFKYNNLIMGCVRNPYWDWDGLLTTPQEEQTLTELSGQQRRDALTQIKQQQPDRKAQLEAMMAQQVGAQPVPQQPVPQPTQDPNAPVLPQMTPSIPTDVNAVVQGGDQQDAATGQAYGAADVNDPTLEIREQQGGTDATLQPEGGELPDLRPYYFNHFDEPRKPYIFATILNNENTPIGRTDMIYQAAPLQENIDETKRDITRNARFVNGIMLIDAEVMDKAEAQRLDTEVSGKIWGKGASTGVKRETGAPLPAFVMDNMQDSRSEVDNIMAASSAFRGEREGQETKAGRLALIDQSYLRLNELVQVVDYSYGELFNWFVQLAKVRYTEHHYAKDMGSDAAMKIISIIQDDFETGSEIRVIGGKTLPEDRQFKYEQAQNDVQAGILAPSDYFEVAGYSEPNQKAKNRVEYNLNPALQVGLSEQEMQQYAPPQQPDMPSRSISFKDLPVDGQVQMAEQAGIKLNPQILIAKEAIAMEDKQHQQALDTQKAQQPPPKGIPPKQ